MIICDWDDNTLDSTCKLSEPHPPNASTINLPQQSKAIILCKVPLQVGIDSTYPVNHRDVPHKPLSIMGNRDVISQVWAQLVGFSLHPWEEALGFVERAIPKQRTKYSIDFQ